MSDEQERDAAEASYQKITRAIEENLLPELVKTSETLSNLAKRARASDMRGVILSDAWIDRMAATMRHAHRRINEQSSTIDRLTTERDQARRDLNAIFELTITDVMAAYDPEQIVHHVAMLRKERDAARAEVKRLRNAVWSAYSDLHAHLYVATNMEGGRLFSAYETLRANYTAIRAALGIESEAGE